MIREGVRRASLVLAVVAASLTALIMLGLTIEVTLRSISGRGLLGMVELTESLLVGAVFLGLAHAERTGRHVSLGLVADRLPFRLSYALHAVAMTFVLALFVWIAYRSGVQAVESFDRGEVRPGIRNIVLWPARTVLLLGVVALILEVGVTVIDSFRSALRGELVGIWRDRQEITAEGL